MIAKTQRRLWPLFLCCAAGAAAQADDATTATPPAPTTLPSIVERLDEEASRAITQCYGYDSTIPLEARIVEKVDKDGSVREKIVFRGVQGFLVPGYLQFPPSGMAPYPCVLLLHGWSGSKENWWQDGNYISGGNAQCAPGSRFCRAGA